jgi:tetratricopeptide (TPR) repeat protein
VVYTELNEYARAQAEFEKIPEADERYAEARLQEAYLSDKQGDYDQAIAKLNDALRKKPNDSEIMGFLVGLYQEKKDYSDAIALAQKMVRLSPRDDKFHFTLGALYDEHKQKTQGVAEMREAILLNPKNAAALNYLGYTYAESGTRLNEAENLIKRALLIEPEDGFYVDSLGWVYYQKGDYRRAVDELERAVNLTGSDPTITEHLGDAYAKSGKTRAAQNQYQDALVKSQDPDQVQRLRAKIDSLSDTQRHAAH